MMHRLLAKLQDIDIDLTMREIVELLWLAEQMQLGGSDAIAAKRRKLQQQPDQNDQSEENRRDLQKWSTDEQQANLYDRHAHSSSGNQISVTPFSSPAATALPDKLQLARALRPLARKVPSQINSVIDEEATIRCIAETGIHIPVLRPAPARWLDVALVTDQTSSMLIWHDTLLELRRLLELHGAFRNVYLWELDTDTAEHPELYARSGSNSSIRRLSKPQELVDPTGRRLILVVSDCVSSAWHTGTIGPLLNLWGRYNSVTLVQMLPRRLWLRTALAAVPEIRIQTPSPATPNTRLRFRAARPRPDRKLSREGRIALPVVTLERNDITTWATMLTGSSTALVPGVLLTTIPTPDQAKRYQTRIDEVLADSAVERLQQFRANASPIAQELAEYFAAAPLSLPVMRIVQQTMLPQSRLSHLAEVVLGGLIERAVPADMNDNSGILFFRFVDGVQELLLNDLPRPEALRVLQESTDFVSSRMGQPNRFRTYVQSYTPDEEITVTDGMKPFAQLSAGALARFGKRPEKLTGQLNQSAEKYKSSLQQHRPREYNDHAAQDSHSAVEGRGGRITPGNSYSAYEAGIQQLLDHLGAGHLRYSEALNYQNRLLENIATARQYGDTETRQAERAQIVEQINALATETSGPLLVMEGRPTDRSPGDKETTQVGGGTVHGPVIGASGGNVTQYNAWQDIHVHNYATAVHNQGNQTPSLSTYDFDPARFIDRRDEIKIFQELLQFDSAVRILIICAGKGTGKSQLLRYFGHLCIENDLPFSLVDFRRLPNLSPPVFVEEMVRDFATPQTGIPLRMYHFAKQQIKKQTIPDWGRDLGTTTLMSSPERRDDDLELKRAFEGMIMDGFLEDLRTYCQHQPAVLLLDTFEQCGAPLQEWIQQSLVRECFFHPDEEPGRLLLVVAGVETAVLEGGLRPSIIKSRYSLSKWNQDDFQEWLRIQGYAASDENARFYHERFAHSTRSLLDILSTIHLFEQQLAQNEGE